MRVHTGKKILSLQIGQVDRRPLDRFVAAVGVGTVLGPYVRRGRNESPYYVLALRGRNGWKALNALWPHLSEPKLDDARRAIRSLLSLRD